MPKVSIMIPSYNHADYVYEAVESVLNQTFQDFEVIASDDHSPDNTVSIIQGFDDPRIHLHVFAHNVGATMNHEYCWQHCTAPYIALLNSDDVWMPEHLEKSVAYLDTHPSCGAVFSWCSFIDEHSTEFDPCYELFRQPNRTKAEWLRRFYTNGNCICHPSMVIRQEVYQKVGFYSRSLRQLPDFDEWIRVVKQYDIHIIPEPLVKHRRCLTTMGNTSAPLLANSLRDVAESKFILSHFFDDMSDELFREAFGPLFRNPQAVTHEELLCERFFLLLDDQYYMKNLSRYVAYDYFHEICNLPGVSEVLNKQYGYTINDYFKLGASIDYLGLKQLNVQPVAQVTASADNVQLIPVAGNINSRSNRLKALTWAVFGRDSKIYSLLQKLYSGRRKGVSA